MPRSARTGAGDNPRWVYKGAYRPASRPAGSRVSQELRMSISHAKRSLVAGIEGANNTIALDNDDTQYSTRIVVVVGRACA